MWILGGNLIEGVALQKSGDATAHPVFFAGLFFDAALLLQHAYSRCNTLIPESGRKEWLRLLLQDHLALLPAANPAGLQKCELFRNSVWSCL